MFNPNELQALYKYAMALCDDESAAFDLVQSAVERCIAKQSEGAPIDAPVSFAKKVLRNSFIDQYRRRTKFVEEPYEEEVFPLDATQAHLEDMVLASIELEKLWPTLAVSDREVLYLWAVEE